VLVQNRVAIAQPRLPEEVRARGVNVRKNSPDLMMVIHLNSPDGSLDQLYISNYGTLQVRDVISRVKGVGEARLFGAREYAMRLWLDPERMAGAGPDHRRPAGRGAGQNVQVASARSTSSRCRSRARSS
jgi:HAE1 family hydrophobic/amphiphilic exporter-1